MVQLELQPFPLVPESQPSTDNLIPSPQTGKQAVELVKLYPERHCVHPLILSQMEQPPAAEQLTATTQTLVALLKR
jgi:hypothetical protein